MPLLPGSHVFDLQPETIFSLVGFSDMAGVTITGARWPLQDQFVPLGSSLTLSNVADGEVRISLTDGEGLFMTGSFG